MEKGGKNKKNKEKMEGEEGKNEGAERERKRENTGKK